MKSEQKSPATQAKDEPKAPELLYRQWTFQSSNPGLHQVLIPSTKDANGNLKDPQFEANFGGDSGREGLWRIISSYELERGEKKWTGLELVQILRNKIRAKPIADANVTELTLDKERGDPVYKPVEGEDDAVPQPSN